MKPDEKIEVPGSTPPEYGDVEETKSGSAFSRFLDSFRKNPHATASPVDAEGKPLNGPGGGPGAPLAAKLKARHLQMIAIGGSISAFTLTSRNPLYWASREALTSTLTRHCKNWPVRWFRICLLLVYLPILDETLRAQDANTGLLTAIGGPGSLILDYGLIGVMLFCTVHALGKMAVTFPVAGSFSAYSSRFLDPAMGVCYGLEVSCGE